MKWIVVAVKYFIKERTGSASFHVASFYIDAKSALAELRSEQADVYI